MRNLTQQLAVILTLLFLPLTSVLAESLVADAAMVEDIERITQLMQQGEDVNTAQGDGMTAIHWAAENGNGAMADLLIAAGANPDATTPVSWGEQTWEEMMIGYIDYVPRQGGAH